MNLSFLTYGRTAQLLDKVLRRCGDITSVILEDDTPDEIRSKCSDVLISEDSAAVTRFFSAESGLNNDPVIVLLSSDEDDQGDRSGSLPADRLLMLCFGSDSSCFSFARYSSNLYLSRVEQHISICLIRSGFKTVPASSSGSSVSRAETPVPSAGRSFAEMVLPACELGLPCDDCGQCH